MPKLKGRSTGRGSWSEDSMKLAMGSVIGNNMSCREAAQAFGVPKSSLHDRIQKLKHESELTIAPKLGRFENTFSEQLELELVRHIKDLDDRLMPLTRKEFLKLAYDLAVHMNVPHRFNNSTQRAGKAFYYSFMKRHPELSLRNAESTSLMRAVGFNKPQVLRFYSKEEELMTRFSFPPTRIFNADETGVSCVYENTKVISLKGKKQVGKMTSGERGQNVTLLFCMSANGQFLPPLFVFPRKEMNDRLMLNAPPESVAVAQQNGWMDADIFLRWMKEFVKHVHPTEGSPVLLIVDGHGSHKDLKVIHFARSHHVHILSTPPHTTHKLQPLDRTFMKPFKVSYNEACAAWMRRNPGLRITVYDIAGLVNEAFTKSCRMEIAKNGFSCTGIYPLCKDVFSDLDFLPSQVTDLPESSQDAGAMECFTKQATNLGQAGINQTPSTSAAETNGSSPINAATLLKQISPPPDGSQWRLGSRKRRSGQAEIFTSTPFKNALEMKEVEKRRRSDVGKAKARKKLLIQEEEQTSCIICGETFPENWVQCCTCKGWAHEACTALESTLIDNYVCDMCFNPP